MSVRRLLVEVDARRIERQRVLPPATASARGSSTTCAVATRLRARPRSSRGHGPRSGSANKTPADDRGPGRRPAQAARGPRPRLRARAKSPLRSLASSTGRRRRPTSIGSSRPAGFITAEPRKAPKRSRRWFTVERANESWQLDDTTWELADGTEVKILNVVDDHSRLLVASTAMAVCTGAAALDCVADAAATLGWPARFQSDNANAFRHVLADALAPARCRGRPLPTQPPPDQRQDRTVPPDRSEMARAPMDQSRRSPSSKHCSTCYRHRYNHHRRHRGLGRRVPAQVWADAPKAGPADRPLRPPTHRPPRHASPTAASTAEAATSSASAPPTTATPALTLVTGTRLPRLHQRSASSDNSPSTPTERTRPLHDPTQPEPASEMTTDAMRDKTLTQHGRPPTTSSHRTPSTPVGAPRPPPRRTPGTRPPAAPAPSRPRRGPRAGERPVVHLVAAARGRACLQHRAGGTGCPGETDGVGRAPLVGVGHVVASRRSRPARTAGSRPPGGASAARPRSRGTPG